MNALRRFTVRSLGYDVDLGAKLLPSDFASITMLAPALLLATAVAAFNCGLAGWQFTKGFPESTRVAVCVGVAIFGAFVVLAIDRAALYYADTSVATGRAMVALILTMRIALILCVSVFTSQAVMPVLLGPELKAQALQLREQRDRAREEDLVRRSGVAEMKADRGRAKQLEERLEGQLERLPQPITQRLESAKRCWAEHAQARLRLNPGDEHSAASRERVAAKAVACRAQTRSAEADRDGYVASTRRALDQARASAANFEVQVSSTEQRIGERIKNAAEIEADALDERSADVLSELLARNRGAFVKWILLTCLLISLELLPFLLKLSAGRSSVGLAIASRRLQLAEQFSSEREKRLDDDKLAWSLRQLVLRAAQELSHSPEAWGRLRSELANRMAAQAPLETVSAFLRELDAEAERVASSVHRHPQYAERIGAVWTAAVDRAIAAMRTSAMAG